MTDVTPDPKPEREPKRPHRYHKFSLRMKGEVRCRNCGSDGPLNLHHIIPKSKYRDGKRELLNGLPLCMDCHSGWHFHTTVLYRDLFTKKEWKYLTSVKLTGEEIGEWLNRHYPTRPQ